MKRTEKGIYFKIVIVLFLFFFIITIPTFCSFLLTKDSNVLYWDGSIATSFSVGDGTVNNPFIISTPNEFAYLSKSVEQGVTYENTYFKIANDLYLNEGVIKYNDVTDTVIYIKDYEQFYIKPYTNYFYGDIEYKNSVGSINIFPSINNFKGNIDGDNNHIYGLYITSSTDEKVGLFRNFHGNLNNLYIENSLIMGGNLTGVITDCSDATINGLKFNGSIKSRPKLYSYVTNISDVTLDSKEQHLLNYEKVDLPTGAIFVSNKVYGDYRYSLDSTQIMVNGLSFNDGTFFNESTELFENINVFADSNMSEGENLVLENMVYEASYYYTVTGMIASATDTIVSNSYSKASIYGDGVVGGIVGVASKSINIRDSYVKSLVSASNISGGVIGVLEQANGKLDKVYNDAFIKGKNIAGGIIGYVHEDNSLLSISNTFNIGNVEGTSYGNIIGNSLFSNLEYSNNYVITDSPSIGNMPDLIAIYIEKKDLLTTDFLNNTLNFLQYDESRPIVGSNVWVLEEGVVPHLYDDDVKPPTAQIFLADKSWNDFSTSVNILRVDKSFDFSFVFNDTNSNILSVEYYICNSYQQMPLDVFNINWKLYEGKNISITEYGNYTVYFKVVDAALNTSYVHSDMIVYDGFFGNLSDVFNDNNFNNYVTNKSTVKYSFKRNYKVNVNPYDTSYKYYLSGNIPEHTKILLIDKNNLKTYYYEVDNSVSTNTMYDLSLFKEIGRNTDNYFLNNINNYYSNGIFCENFDIILDFSDGIISDNLLFSLDFVIADSSLNIITKRVSSYDNFLNVIKKSDTGQDAIPKLNLSTDYKEYFDYQKDQQVTINLNTELNYQEIDGNIIYDSNFFKENMNIVIQLLDSDKKVVKGNIVNGLAFIVNGSSYYSDNLGKIFIPNVHKIGEALPIKIVVETFANDLKNGTYYFKIVEASSNKKNIIDSNELLIPVKINNNTFFQQYKFKIDMNYGDRIFIRNDGKTSDGNSSISFNVLYDGTLVKPNVRVALYRKVNLNSYDFSYELIELDDYLKTSLSTIGNEKLLIEELSNNSNNVCTLNFDFSKFSFGAYKLVFKLYDGDNYVLEQAKTFIVK